MTRTGRIQARPVFVDRAAPDHPGRGELPLELGRMRDGYLYVPTSYNPNQPAALMLMLHGSGGHAHHGVELLQELAEAAGVIVVAPTSKFYTWSEAPHGQILDARTVNRALEHVFANYAIDPARMSVAGFSDGASYAMTLGLLNGELFKHVIAFSPRFVVNADPHDARHIPHIFISHGMRDEVMPISTASQLIVLPLERAGVDVEYAEFEAGHRIPPSVAKQAMEWLTKASASARDTRRGQSPEIQPIQEG
jgi:phospholipase/carboxylesterase